jgi:hypothetical protein
LKSISRVAKEYTILQIYPIKIKRLRTQELL